MKQIVQTIALSLSVFSMPTFAALEDVTVMALGSLDGRAVVKTKDGKMKVLKVGDTVPTSKAVVKQILNDRLVVEEMVAKDKDKYKETVWIYKPSKAGGKSRIQRLSKKGAEPDLGKPLTETIKLESKSKK